jgi:hypothetical protein
MKITLKSHTVNPLMAAMIGYALETGEEFIANEREQLTIFRNLIQEESQVLRMINLSLFFQAIPLSQIGEIPDVEDPSVQELLSFYLDSNHEVPRGVTDALHIPIVPGQLAISATLMFDQTMRMLDVCMRAFAQAGVPAESLVTMAPLCTTINRYWHTNLYTLRTLRNAGHFSESTEILIRETLDSVCPVLGEVFSV